MSDNPADSSRRELAPCDYEHGREGQVCHCHDELVPALRARVAEIEAALEAARADERDRLEAENQQLRANLEEVKGQLANCHKFIAKAVPPGTFVVMSDD